MNTLEKYYAHCAASYDAVYGQEERQDDLDDLQEAVAELMQGHKVLELACGSGYWTEFISIAAESVMAIDASPEMLALAAKRDVDPDIVTFAQGDAVTLADIPAGQYTACFAAGWWSHIGRAEQDKYLALLRSKLGKDALLVLLDSNQVEGVSVPIARTVPHCAGWRAV
jgi:ubiquinone/menaquinone biosynthesis C-methylase UbiE